MNEFHLNELYGSGHLRHGSDLDFFLSSLLNHDSDEGKSKNIPRSMLKRGWRTCECLKSC
jgi:hypothetical protein